MIDSHPHASGRAAAQVIAAQVANGGKVYICGNGGSASMASHFAAELLVRYERVRPPIPCINLAADQSVITACANDLGYEEVFARQVDAFCRRADVLIVLSTSGKSRNILWAMERAERLGVYLLYPDGRRPDESVADCQERHLHWLHQVAYHLELILYPQSQEVRK